MVIFFALGFEEAKASCVRKTLEDTSNSARINLLYWLEDVSICMIKIPVPDGFEIIDISLVSKPNRGNVKQIDGTIFQYTKNPDHLGIDQFILKICAKKQFSSSGCTQIAYNMNSIRINKEQPIDMKPSIPTPKSSSVQGKPRKSDPQTNPNYTPNSSSGTAFRIANGQFVTNYHVIEECASMKVGGLQGGRVLAIDAINDLALISVPNDSGDIASIRATRTQLNEAVTVAGFPLQSVFSGIAIIKWYYQPSIRLKG